MSTQHGQKGGVAGGEEKIRKKEKIMLDKWGTGWYPIEAVQQDGPAERRCVRKQIEKDLKKALDKAMRRW